MPTALVLSAGGARAAYQVGVLKRVAELSSQLKQECPFKILCGTSAGAINIAVIASRFSNFKLATRGLERVWNNFRVHQVYRTDLGSLFRISTQWIRDLGLGGILGGKMHVKSLLDTSPLHTLISKVIEFESIQRAIESGDLEALAITATSYSTGKAKTFIHGQEKLEPWARARRIGQMSKITANHILASSAIPLLFPSIPINGEYYGDGGIRFHTPLSPAARLGAQKIIAVGVRHGQVDEVLEEKNPLSLPISWSNGCDPS